MENAVRSLLGKGADEREYGFGRTPLRWAVVYTELRLRRRVSALNGDEGQARATGKHLFKREHEGLILKELENRFHIDSKDKLERATPLHLAIRRWILVPSVERQSALVLLKNGSNANLQDASGNTPLHLAVAGGHIKAVQLLVKRGANINMKNKAGKTPFQVAKERRKAPSKDQSFSLRASSYTSYYDSSEDEGEREQIIELLESHAGSNGTTNFPSPNNG
ncbi:hypothetical protein MMC30_002487 [Trapelia coarctata]|nr:hypothetical protein [Trapelia coarctata]